VEQALIDELRDKHGAHTIILYGSHARGAATKESDVDAAAFADGATIERDARVWNGVYLDAFIYPTSVARAPNADLLKLRGGRVLLDERGLADPLLEQLDALDQAGPPPLAASEKQMRRVWARKMLGRIDRGDLESNYRRHWLLYQLLEDYFDLRGQWFRGPKLAFAQLDPDTRAAFERALAVGAPTEDIAALVERVLDEPA
jgi:hypothetical protein